MVTVRTDKGKSVGFEMASLLGDAGGDQQDGDSDGDDDGEGGSSSSSSSSSSAGPVNDGWGPLFTGVVILPNGTGKGRCIQLGDVGNVTCKATDGVTTITIKSKKNDLLFEGHSSSPAGGRENVSEVLRRAIVYGQQRILNGTPAEKAGSSTSSTGSMNVLEKNLYFAKKEKEVTAKRKAAQARKEKFMKDSGGLKYTAIAMAKM